MNRTVFNIIIGYYWNSERYFSGGFSGTRDGSPTDTLWAVVATFRRIRLGGRIELTETIYVHIAKSSAKFPFSRVRHLFGQSKLGVRYRLTSSPVHSNRQVRLDIAKSTVSDWGGSRRAPMRGTANIFRILHQQLLRQCLEYTIY